MSKHTLGPHGIDLTAPGGIAALLEFHRATFGDARMEDDPDAAAAAEAATASAAADAAAEFPANTPVKDMTVEQQAAYWKHQSRKHEDRARSVPQDYDAIKAERDELKARTQTDAEKAIEDARREARDQALAEANKTTLPRLVQAEFKAAAAGRIPADRLATLLEPLDLTKFLTADGSEVDTDKVTQYVAGIAPTTKEWPGMGQGRREHSKASGVSAGKSLYEERHAKKQ